MREGDVKWGCAEVSVARHATARPINVPVLACSSLDSASTAVLAEAASASAWRESAGCSPASRRCTLLSPWIWRKSGVRENRISSVFSKSANAGPAKTAAMLSSFASMAKAEEDDAVSAARTASCSWWSPPTVPVMVISPSSPSHSSSSPVSSSGLAATARASFSVDLMRSMKAAEPPAGLVGVDVDVTTVSLVAIANKGDTATTDCDRTFITAAQVPSRCDVSSKSAWWMKSCWPRRWNSSLLACTVASTVWYSCSRVRITLVLRSSTRMAKSWAREIVCVSPPSY